jgi:small subunit ribosomal protein S3e
LCHHLDVRCCLLLGTGPWAAVRGTKRISTKRKFIADKVFYAELNNLLIAELAEDSYAGVEVRTTPHHTELIIRATCTQNVLGENNRRIRELTSVVQKRFDFAVRCACYRVVRFIMEASAKGCEVVESSVDSVPRA